MAGASSLLMLRAIALWGRDKRIVIPLVITHLGQWGVGIRKGFLAKEHWDDTEMSCVIDNVTWPAMKLGWMYSQSILTFDNGMTAYGVRVAMVFDFVVLVVASWALLRAAGRSNLVKLLFFDGLAYFVGMSWRLHLFSEIYIAI